MSNVAKNVDMFERSL